MGFFDDMKSAKLGQKAYNVHLQANDLNRRGRMAEAKQKFEEARRLYGEAYDEGCRKTNIMMSYAVLLMRLGEFERARELMREISARGGLSEDAHFELRMNYAVCLWRLGILDKAIETAAYAGKYAKNGSYYASMGTFLVEQAGQTGSFEKARAFLDEAMEYDDEDAATLDNYGEYYRLLSEREADPARAAEYRAQSKDYYERAHERKPSQITTLYALARFARQDGDFQRGRELTERAMQHLSSKVCPVSMEQLQQLLAEME